MAIQTQLISVSATPAQVQAPTADSAGLVRRIHIEPLAANVGGPIQVGTASITPGTGVGVIRELAKPTAGAILDQYDEVEQCGNNRIDPALYWLTGTTGDKAKVTLYIG